MGSIGWTACGWYGIEGENFHIPDLTLYPLCDDCHDILWDTCAPPGGGRVAACMAWWRAVRILEELDDTMLNRIAKFQHGWDAPWPDHRDDDWYKRWLPQQQPHSPTPAVAAKAATAVAEADARSDSEGGDSSNDC